MALRLGVLLAVYVVRCQASNVSTEPGLVNRIYNGQSARIEEYTHAVFLHFEATSPSSCGGSLIMVQHILTAGHCVDELRYKRGKMHAYLGSTIPKSAKVTRRVVDFNICPGYDQTTGQYNLAIAFMERRVPLLSFIKKIPLTVKDPKADEIVWSAGWGKQKVNRPHLLPDISSYRELRSTKQGVLSRQDCAHYSGFSPPSEGCAHKTIYSVSHIGHFYKDDSGNGLVSRSNLLVGVLSFVAGGISIHTGVVAHRDWIRDASNTLYNNNCLRKRTVVFVKK